MIQNLAKHKLILIVIAIVIAGGAWYGLSASSSGPTPDLVTTAPGGTKAADQDLVATLLQLRAVKLDGGILTDPAFTNLKDFSTDIVPEPVGRTNPFAPLSSQASPSATTTSSAQIFTPRR